MCLDKLFLRVSASGVNALRTVEVSVGFLYSSQNVLHVNAGTENVQLLKHVLSLLSDFQSEWLVCAAVGVCVCFDS